VRTKQVVWICLLVLVAAACSGGGDVADDSSTTATIAPASVTTLAPTPDTEGDPGVTSLATTVTTQPPELGFPTYTIVSREAGDEGDIVVVLLDQSTYESLTDIDLHNVIADVVERFSPIFEVYVVDTQAAADALLATDRTVAQEAELDQHYLARLEEGFRIVYVGPYESAGIAILGS